MSTKHYNKLIRDGVPNFIAKDKQVARFYTMSDSDYETALQEKLYEEASEYFESKDATELADILEVVQALAEHQGLSFEDILFFKEEKRKRCGGFTNRLFLETIEIPEE